MNTDSLSKIAGVGLPPSETPTSDLILMSAKQQEYARNKKLGLAIWKIRKDQDMRQSELSLRSGIKQPSVSRIENGLISADDRLEKIAQALGKTVEEIENFVPEEQCKLSAKHSIGEKIVELRKAKNMKQRELVAITGLKQPNVSRIEAGLVYPRNRTLEKIAKALDANVAELIRTQEQTKTSPQNAATATQ